MYIIKRATYTCTKEPSISTQRSIGFQDSVQSPGYEPYLYITKRAIYTNTKEPYTSTQMSISFQDGTQSSGYKPYIFIIKRATYTRTKELRTSTHKRMVFKNAYRALDTSPIYTSPKEPHKHAQKNPVNLHKREWFSKTHTEPWIRAPSIHHPKCNIKIHKRALYICTIEFNVYAQPSLTYMHKSVNCIRANKPYIYAQTTQT